MVKVDFDKESRERLRSYELLSRDREQELLEAIAKGDINARNELIERHLRLVVAKAGFLTRGVNRRDLEHDLVSVAVIYLMGATEKYNAKVSRQKNNGQPVRFLTYTRSGFESYMRRALVEMMYTVRPKDAGKYILYKQALMKIRGQGVITPTEEMIAAESGLTKSKIRRYMDFDRRLPRSLESVGPSSNGESETMLKDRIPAEDNGSLERIADADTIKTHLPVLSRRERAVIELRYLANSLTFERIGECIGVGGERARQIEAGAIKKLKESIEGKVIPKYSE